MNTKIDRTLARRVVAAAAVPLAAAAFLVAAPASAQEATATASTGGATAVASTGGGATAGGTDHGHVVGRLAIAWLGVNGVPIGDGSYGQTASVQANNTVVPDGTRCGLPASNGQNFLNLACRPVLNNTAENAPVVSAPTVGIRYWFAERMGVDAGIGLGIYSGGNTSYPYPGNPVSQDVTFKRDKTSVLAFTLHAGVPIVLGEPSKHYNFQVIPEANVGFASGTIKDQNPPPAGQINAGTPAPAPTREDIKIGGFRLDVGARAGAEIQFGFLGIPELALQGTVGLYFTYRSVSATTGGKTASDSSTGISTSVQQAPWAIFTNNISALYYF